MDTCLSKKCKMIFNVDDCQFKMSKCIDCLHLQRKIGVFFMLEICIKSKIQILVCHNVLMKTH